MSETLVVVSELQPGVITITLNRPEKRNALSMRLLEEVTAAFTKARSSRIILLQGAGPVFCAGLDLEEAADIARAQHLAEGVSRVLQSIDQAQGITICLVQGAAIAGGAGLVAACDLAVAEEDCCIGFPETRRGLVAALIMTVLRRRLTGRHVSELLLLGEAVNAQRALSMGLVNRVVAKNDLLAMGLNLAQLGLQGAPLATSQTKRLLDTLEPRSLLDDLVAALATHNEARTGQEAQEGINAFLEKRDPYWCV